MSDLSDLYTDKKERELRRTISRIYGQAEKDIGDKLTEYAKQYEKEEAKMLAKLKAKKITQKQFDSWKQVAAFSGESWDRQKQNMADVLANANRAAASMVRNEQFNVFRYSQNYAAYEIEHGLGVSFGFDVYDQQAVEHLLRDNPNILPFKKLDKRKDVRWNFRNIRSQIAQGIIQGESIPKIAERLAAVVPNRNKKQMVLHARTAMTSAHNAGRMERDKEAMKLGINMQKRWIASLDSRTRDLHADLDGQTVDMDKPFEIAGYKIDFPGDPHAAPEMVYNCRCDYERVLKDYPSEYRQRRAYDESIDENGKMHRKSYLIKDMNYREWERWKNNGGH